jgi:glycerol uptake facilitator-like aquaporin
MYKYFIEYLGVLVIVIATLLTESDPIIMGLVYFSTLTTTQGITDGYFNPFVPIATFILGHGSTEDVMYNLIAQVAGGITAILFIKPIKIYIS